MSETHHRRHHHRSRHSTRGGEGGEQDASDTHHRRSHRPHRSHESGESREHSSHRRRRRHHHSRRSSLGDVDENAVASGLESLSLTQNTGMSGGVGGSMTERTGVSGRASSRSHVSQRSHHSGGGDVSQRSSHSRACSVHSSSAYQEEAGTERAQNCTCGQHGNHVLSHYPQDIVRSTHQVDFVHDKRKKQPLKRNPFHFPVFDSERPPPEKFYKSSFDFRTTNSLDFVPYTMEKEEIVAPPHHSMHFTHYELPRSQYETDFDGKYAAAPRAVKGTDIPQFPPMLSRIPNQKDHFQTLQRQDYKSWEYSKPERHERQWELAPEREFVGDSLYRASFNKPKESWDKFNRSLPPQQKSKHYRVNAPRALESTVRVDFSPKPLTRHPTCPRNATKKSPDASLPRPDMSTLLTHPADNADRDLNWQKVTQSDPLAVVQ